MERGLRRETPIVEWDTLIHPDMEAITRRDTFLNQPQSKIGRASCRERV